MSFPYSLDISMLSDIYSEKLSLSPRLAVSSYRCCLLIRYLFRVNIYAYLWCEMEVMIHFFSIWVCSCSHPIYWKVYNFTCRIMLAPCRTQLGHRCMGEFLEFLVIHIPTFTSMPNYHGYHHFVPPLYCFSVFYATNFSH